MAPVIKLSSPATREFWEIPVLYEDTHLLAISKPAGLLSSPDRYDPTRPNLMKLLHAAIAAGKPWAKERQLTYLMNAHRLDFETSGVLLLAKAKPILTALADLFGSERLAKNYIALVHGSPEAPEFEVDAPLAPHPLKAGVVRVDRKQGKRARTEFEVLERFGGYALLKARPVTGRTHQIRVHLQFRRLPIVGDRVYGGKPLFLSSLKRNYELGKDKVERPLIATTALHAESVTLTHPATGENLHITAPWPKALTVGVKYLRRYAGSGPSPLVSPD